jgi:hypothetical protein
MECVDELYQLVEEMARSLEEVRGPFGDHFRRLARGVHEVARKLESRLVREAAVHRQATFADGELKDSASGGAVAPPESHRVEVAELDNQPSRGRRYYDVAISPPPECRIRIPVTTTSGTLCTHPENTAPIPTMAMTITGSSKNGASDTDGRCDGRT